MEKENHIYHNNCMYFQSAYKCEEGRIGQPVVYRWYGPPIPAENITGLPLPSAKPQQLACIEDCAWLLPFLQLDNISGWIEQYTIASLQTTVMAAGDVEEKWVPWCLLLFRLGLTVEEGIRLRGQYFWYWGSLSPIAAELIMIKKLSCIPHLLSPIHPSRILSLEKGNLSERIWREKTKPWASPLFGSKRGVAVPIPSNYSLVVICDISFNQKGVILLPHPTPYPNLSWLSDWKRSPITLFPTTPASVNKRWKAHLYS